VSSAPLNRIDFTAIYFDSEKIDRVSGLLGYTRNLSPRSKLNVRAAWVHSRLETSSGTGLGDTAISWSYLPNVEMSIGPWLPRIVGSGISVSLPTGNEDEGRGLGSTIITPFVGGVFPLTDTLSISPNLAYAHSLNKIFTDTDVRVAVLEVGLTRVVQDGWWWSIYTGYVSDFETKNTTFGGRVSAGKVFNKQWGMTFHFIDYEHFLPGVIQTERQGINYVFEAQLSYGF
jgi:hypothetical protein